jgi:hypothetical protein
MGQGRRRRPVSQDESEAGMMLDTIKKKLAALDCDAWELTETKKRGWEFYFIRHKLD